MINLKPIFLVIGTLISILAIMMLIPFMVDFQAGNTEWQAFALSAFFTFFCGMSLFLTNKEAKRVDLSIKQVFIITTASWVVLVLFSSLPFLFSDMEITFTDAFFESMSGLTTTGATVLTGLDGMLPGILVWRSILQWIGGIGIIVMAMAVLPMLKIGGMQLYRSESSDNADKVLPRATQVCGAITSVYLLLTVICAFCLWKAGMSPFDAINHAMTTIATSGFSTHDSSIGYFDSQAVELTMIFFMIASGIPLILYIQLLRGKSFALWNDTQVRVYLTILIIGVVSMTAWLSYSNGISLDDAFRKASFNVVSITTTTGFTSDNYNIWGGFAIAAMFVFGVVGGCTGSTAGGIKIFRFLVLFTTARAHVNKMMQPHGVFLQLYNAKPISENASNSVMSFVIIFGICFSVIAILFSATGLDFVTSMSASASAMANLGPGLGDIIGPAGNYSSISDNAKWIMSAGMLIGRLEIFTVLILFLPYFWKN